MLGWSEVLILHLLCRDLQVGQDLPDVTEEGWRAAEVVVVAGDGLRGDLQDAVFGDAVGVNLKSERH